MQQLSLTDVEYNLRDMRRSRTVDLPRILIVSMFYLPATVWSCVPELAGAQNSLWDNCAHSPEMESEKDFEIQWRKEYGPLISGSLTHKADTKSQMYR